MASQVKIDGIVRMLKTVPAFRLLQEYISEELERERELYENSEAMSFCVVAYQSLKN